VVLAFIPLMQGGGQDAIIGQWIALASAETDSGRRADFGGLALVFAEAAGCAAAWKKALEGWNVVQSQQVLEWQAQAGARILLTVLESRFGSLPTELTAAIRGTVDGEVLNRWAVLAGSAPSLDQFRQDAGV
jgi:hypothetical protein